MDNTTHNQQSQTSNFIEFLDSISGEATIEANKDNVANKGLYGQSTSTGNTISPSEGLNIYIKAIKKVLSLIDRARPVATQYNKVKNSRNPSEIELSKKKYLEFTNLILEVQEIITEFIKGFSVSHTDDTSAIEFMKILFERFQYLQERINMYHIFAKESYGREVYDMLNRILETFEKMLQYANSEEAKARQDKPTSKPDNTQLTDKKIAFEV